jgi:hypothetical protein
MINIFKLIKSENHKIFSILCIQFHVPETELK